MKFKIAVILLASQIVLSGCTTPTSPSSEAFNLLSFNIRYNTPEDGINAWPHRKQHVADLIQFHQADIVGVQEARPEQLADLSNDLPQYTWFGIARDDNKDGSEYTPILYRSDKMTLHKQGTFWCSSTPDIPSKGWDAKHNRTVTWGHFKRADGKSFYVFNTHFDHKGKKAKEECAKLLRSRIDDIAHQDPVIVTGDFNSKPFSQPYLNLTDNKPYKKALFDASKTSKLKPYGPKFSLTLFDIAAAGEHPIDYVLTSKDIEVNRFGVLSDSVNGRLPSDHYPLLVEVTLD